MSNKSEFIVVLNMILVWTTVSDSMKTSGTSTTFAEVVIVASGWFSGGRLYIKRRDYVYVSMKTLNIHNIQGRPEHRTVVSMVTYFVASRARFLR